MANLQNESDNSSDYEGDLLYFESSRLPLREDPKYQEILRTIARLHAQKNYTIERIKELQKSKEYYVEHMGELIKKLKDGEQIVPPDYGEVIELPDIDCNPRRTSSAAQCSLHDKTGSSQHPWTEEECRQLELLLIQYPKEEIELKRYCKIASVLKNRTALEVESRVQEHLAKGAEILQTKVENKCADSPYSHNNTDDSRNYLLKTGSLNRIANEVSLRQRKQTEYLKIIRDENDNDNDNGAHSVSWTQLCSNCFVDPLPLRNWYCRTCNFNITLCLNCATTQIINDDFEHLVHDIVLGQNPNDCN